MHVGAFEAKNTLGALLDRAEQGEEIIITRHGKPVARLGPWLGRIDPDAARTVLERIRARARALALSPLASSPLVWEALKADRDAGRP